MLAHHKPLPCARSVCLQRKTHYASAANSHPNRLRICESSPTIVHSQFTGFKIYALSSISNPPDYLAHAPIIDSLTFVMLSHTTTRPTLARSLHQQVLINSSTPSTSALSDSLPQPSTTPTAFGSSCILASFRQPSAAPDNPASLSTAFGSLRSLQQPSAVSASLRSLTFDFTFTSPCSHRLNSGRTSYKHYRLFHLDFTSQYSHRLNSGRTSYKHYKLSHLDFTSQCNHRLNSGRTSYKHSDAPTRFPLATLTSVF